MYSKHFLPYGETSTVRQSFLAGKNYGVLWWWLMTSEVLVSSFEPRANGRVDRNPCRQFHCDIATHSAAKIHYQWIDQRFTAERCFTKKTRVWCDDISPVVSLNNLTTVFFSSVVRCTEELLAKHIPSSIQTMTLCCLCGILEARKESPDVLYVCATAFTTSWTVFGWALDSNRLWNANHGWSEMCCGLTMDLTIPSAKTCTAPQDWNWARSH